MSNNFKCLLIEDSLVQSKYIEIMLNYCGWTAVKAYNCIQAKTEIKNQTFDLILGDLVLPDAPDGEIIELIFEKAPDTIIAAMSAAGEVNLKNTMLFAAKKNGASFLLNKPFSRQNFAAFLKEVEYRIANNTRLIHILVVDDSSSIRNICEKLLVETGFRVSVCESMDIALRDIDLLDVDVIISDLNMPGREPKEAIPLIRNSIPEVAIIAMSGNSGFELENMKNIGADAIISKPFNVADILNAIEIAFNAHEEKDINNFELPLSHQL